MLYKRKAVFLHEPKVPPDDDTEVWYIPITRECFVDYDDYLKRIDYYNEVCFFVVVVCD